MNDNTTKKISSKISELCSTVPVDNTQGGLLIETSGGPIVNAQGEVANPAPAPAIPSGTLKPFADGQVLKFTENPLKRSTFNIFTGTGESVAVCINAAMAELFVNAVNVMFAAAAELELKDFAEGKRNDAGTLTKEATA